VPTFFVDENDLALGRLLAAEHDGVVYPGHPGTSPRYHAERSMMSGFQSSVRSVWL
jgi:hypothetical protein